jgi:hypothetical protein
MTARRTGGSIPPGSSLVEGSISTRAEGSR